MVESCFRRGADNTWQPKWYHALSWCRLAGLAEKYEKLFPDRFVISRFEALLEDPAAEMQRLDEFAGSPSSLNNCSTNALIKSNSQRLGSVV